MLVILLPVLAIVLIVDPDNLFHEGEKSTDAATNEQPTMTLTDVAASEIENIDNGDAAFHQGVDRFAHQFLIAGDGGRGKHHHILA